MAEALKKMAAEAALGYLKSNTVIGLGSGSTVNAFIEVLGASAHRHDLEGVCAASSETEKRLKALGIPVLDLNAVGTLPVYFDGADEVDGSGHMIKGGGGALTREKIIAAASKQFICMADGSKKVTVLGQSFPVAIEVIPMARSYVARELVTLGANPVYREGFLTDNGNVIIDAHHLDILNPVEVEVNLNQIAGLVAHGIFAKRAADVVLLGTEAGVVESQVG